MARFVSSRGIALLGCAGGVACSLDARAPTSAEAPATPEPEELEPADEEQADAAAPATPAPPPPAAATEVDDVSDGAAPGAILPADVLLTIEAAGSGRFGRVVSNEPSTVACDTPPCTFSLPRGTSLVLQAQTANVGSGFAGWVHDRCMGQADCPLTLSEDEVIAASYEPANLVFITSTDVTGDFGGPAQADAICNARAAERGLEGPFRAWVSSTASNALDALQGSRGWVRVDNFPVVDSVDELLESKMFYPIQIDETGTGHGNRMVWTATNGNAGQLAALHCNDWSSASAEVRGAVGRTNLVGRNFTFKGFSNCDALGGIYCFGTGKNVSIAPIPSAGRVAFITDQLFTVGGGIAGADAFCQSTAEAGALTGRYKALLATSTESAAARFDLADTRRIVRVDGTLVTLTARLFFEGPNWITGINVAPSGAYITNYPIWSGASSLLVAGVSGETCNDWTAIDAQGRAGFSTFTTTAEFFQDVGSLSPCNTPMFISCLEE